MRKFALTCLVVFFASVSCASERLVILNSPENLLESGFWSYVLPRFKLKTGINIEHGSEEDAQVLVTRNDASTISLFRYGLMEHGRSNQQYTVELVGDSAFAVRFTDWLISEIGQRTISSYKEADQQVYFPIKPDEKTVDADVMTGDVVIGEEVAIKKCGRCHVISERNKYGGIDSTPSFGALRTLADWREKFAVFWTLNPHPSFTQIEEVTEPFDPSRPPHIYPIYLNLTEVENIGAFMETIAPKDLGPPISHN